MNATPDATSPSDSQREKRAATAMAELARAGAQCYETKAGGYIVMSGGFLRSIGDLSGLEQLVNQVYGRNPAGRTKGTPAE